MNLCKQDRLDAWGSLRVAFTQFPLSKNKKTVSFEYDYATEFNKYGYAAVKKDDKWGAIDENGKIIAEPHFELNEIYGEADFIGEYIKVNNGSGNVYYTKDI